MYWTVWTTVSAHAPRDNQDLLESLLKEVIPMTVADIIGVLAKDLEPTLGERDTISIIFGDNRCSTVLRVMVGMGS